MKFHAKFLREFVIEIEANSMTEAQKAARLCMSQIEGAKLMSIHVDGYKEPPEPQKPLPFGTPPKGGSPGTPVVKQEILVDQIAEAA